MRNAQGQISLPSADTIVNRDTTDYSFNIGIDPTLHLGTNVFTFNGGIQETIRRDSRSRGHGSKFVPAILVRLHQFVV